jgi:hypothetical protein
MFSRSLIDNFRRIIDDSRCVIYDSGMMLQLVSSCTIITYDCHIFIVQVTKMKSE